MVSSVVPARSPKPILQSLKLTADADNGAVLMGTDLEAGIRHRVSGVKVDEPGSMILPTAQIGLILRTSGDDELTLESDGAKLVVRGLHSEFKLATEDARLFPDVPEFTATNYHVIAAADLKRLIRRTIFATDPESTRYALGGVLVELTAESIAMVGTDGRRLAKMSSACEVKGNFSADPGSPVIPAKALKLIDRNIDAGDPPVHLSFATDKSVMIRTAQAVIYSRLVEGRFPRYQDAFPEAPGVRIPIEVNPLRAAVEQASIVTSQESRGVDFRFGGGALRLATKSADVGSSEVEMPIDYDGDDIAITFDPKYLHDALKTIDGGIVTAELIDAKSAAVFKTEDGYSYVVMPLSKS